MLDLEKAYQLGCPACVYLSENDELATFCKNVFLLSFVAISASPVTTASEAKRTSKDYSRADKAASS